MVRCKRKSSLICKWVSFFPFANFLCFYDTFWVLISYPTCWILFCNKLCEVKVFVNFDWCSLITQYLSKWMDPSKVLVCVLKYLNYSLGLKLTKTSLVGNALKKGQNKFGIRAIFLLIKPIYLCISKGTMAKRKICIIQWIFGVCYMAGHKGCKVVLKCM